MEREVEMLVAEISALSEAIEAQGMWIKGSQGQDRLNPAIAARRQAIDTLRKIRASFPAQGTLPGLEEFGLRAVS